MGDEPATEPEPATFRKAMAEVIGRSSLGQVKPGETPSGRALLAAISGAGS